MTPVGRPTLDSQIQALSKRLLGGPINLEKTTEIEDRLLARMEELDLVEMGTTTARLTEKGKLLAGGGKAPAAGPTPVAAPAKGHRGPQRIIDADPAAMVWGELPARIGRSPWFEPFEAALTAKPGKWASVLTLETPKEASGTASGLRGNLKKASKPFEVAARGCAIYARFTGKK